MSEPNDFAVHHLRFEVEATTALALDAPAGPKLRAALYQAMGMVCPAGGDANAPPEHKAACPVCWLLATEKPGDRGGKDLPRPVTIEPPLEGLQLRPGECFAFGLTVFAQAANLFPYLALGVPEMGRRGVGRKLPELGFRRGQFGLLRAEAVNPVSQEHQSLLDAARGPLFAVPAIPVTAEQVAAWADRRIAGWQAAAQQGGQTAQEPSVTIDFLTPTRIVTDGRLVHTPLFVPLLARLLDRLKALSKHYADAELVPDGAKPRLMALADEVRLVAEQSRWYDAHSYSRRQQRRTPVSGFVGRATYRAPLEVWRALLPYLVWGQSIHVGKSATRGDGWYEVRG